MARRKDIDKDIEQKIIQEYGKCKAKILAEKYDVTLSQVYDVGKRNGLTKKCNPIFNFSETSRQIILSGILGDGRLKKNGKKNYYYSECHALGEKEYCIWKHEQLIKDDISVPTMLYGKNLNNEHNDAIEFCTRTSPSLIPYANMSKLEIIEQLNELGLLLYLLDDGWISKHSKLGNFVLCTYLLTVEERLAVTNKYNTLLGTHGHDIGHKRVDTAFSSDDNFIFFNIAKEYIPLETDIVQKKFETMLIK